MSTTQFQTVHNAIQQLVPKLATMQHYASQSGSPLYNDVTMRTCSQIFDALITELRGSIATNACTTAKFLVNNILSGLAQHEQSTDTKKLALKRFLESASLRDGGRNASSLANKFNRLLGSINQHYHTLSQMGSNPESVINLMRTVLGGLNNIKQFYNQIERSIGNFRIQLDQGAGEVQGVESEVRWLTAMSVDLNNI